MGKLTAAGNTKILYGANDITSYFNAATIDRAKDLPDVTTFDKTARTYAEGLKSGKLTLTGFYDDTAANIDAILNTAFASTDTVLTIGTGTHAEGKVCYLGNVQKASYSTPIRVEEIVGLSADFTFDGMPDRGVWLRTLAAITAIGNGTTNDGGAATTNGGAISVHCTVDDVTTMTILIEGSANSDMSVASTLATIVVTATGATITEITGTVHRYTRARVSVFTGTSATVAVALARR